MPASIAPMPHISRPAAWAMAARPKTLPAAVSPVIVGSAVTWAQGGFHLLTAAAAISVALLLQIGANLANDVADFQRGADTNARLGPDRVTQRGLLTPGQVTAATVVVLAATAIPGLYLVWRGGVALAALGLLAIAAAVAYTGGPRPFGYDGLGELFVFLFFGPVAVAGTAYAMTGALEGLALAASVPMGALIAAILVVNNLRDIETDRAAGKLTIAVRLGVGATRREYAALLLLAYAIPLVVWWVGLAGPGVLMSWATVPMAVMLIRRVHRVTGRALNPVLAGTARLCLWFAIAFSVGIVL